MSITGNLWEEVVATRVSPGTLSLWWLYQAGLLVKSPGGTTLAIDPYLSDSCSRSHGLVRAVPAPIDPAQAAVDALLATHAHADHLDPGSISGFMSHPGTRFVGPPSAAERVIEAGVERSRTLAVRRGDVVEVGDLTVRVVHARHHVASEPTPDAVGYIVEQGGTRVYHSGDTEYDSEIVADTLPTSVSLICINGTGGNMNAQEAAMLAWRQQTFLAVPIHYGLWSDAGYGEGATLDPQLFVDTYHRLNPEGRTLLLTVGEKVTVAAKGLSG